MPMQPGDLLPVSRAGVPYKATQRDVLGNRLWVDGEVVNDANDATANGWYRAAAGAANLPLTTNLNIQVVSYVPGVWTLQTAHALGLLSATDSATWIRWQAAGAWQPWQKLALLPTEQTGTGGGGGPEYVLKAGDRMSGQLASSVTGGWAFVGNSIPGTNDSGLYCDGDSNYIFALRDKTGAITVDINSNGDAFLNALLLRDLAGATPAPLAVDVNGLLVRGAGPDLSGYVKKTGDQLSGGLASNVVNAWAFVGNSIPGVNESGLYCDVDENYIFALRDKTGKITVDINSLGDAALNGLLLRDLAGADAAPVLVDANGILARGSFPAPPDLSAYVRRTGDQMTGYLANSATGQWAFVGNSVVGVNESGLYCDVNDNYILALRDQSGAITVDINSLGDATLNALLLRDLAGSAPAPLWVQPDGLVVRGAEPDLRPYLQRTGDTLSGPLASGVKGGWAFVTNSKPGVNESGLFALGDDNVVLGLRSASGELTVNLDGKTGTGSFDGPLLAKALRLSDLAGPGTPGPVVVDADGTLGRGVAPDLGNYVAKAGDTMSGALQSSVDLGWVFVANSNGKNESGLFAIGDGNTILALRDVDGEIIFDANSKNGLTRSTQYLALAKPDQWAYVFASRPGTNESGFFVDKDGNHLLSLRDNDGEIVFDANAKTGWTQSKAYLSFAEKKRWAYFFASKPTINDSGFYVDEDGNHEMTLRDVDGEIVITALAGVKIVAASEYVANSSPGHWAYSFASIQDVNTSGFYVDAEGHQSLELRNKDGDIVLSASSKEGLVRASQYIAQSAASTWAYVFASHPGVNDSGFYVDADGNHLLSLRDNTGKIIFDANAKTGLVQAQNYISYVPQGWCFAAANDPTNVNISGLYSEADGSYTLGMRENSGRLTINLSSRDGIGHFEGLLVKNNPVAVADGGSYNLLSHGIDFAALSEAP